MRHGLPHATNVRDLTHEQRIGLVIDTAYEIVSSEGAEALTIARLARELGWSNSVVHDLVGNRESVLTQLFFYGSNGFSDVMFRVIRELPDDANAMQLVHRLAHCYRDIALNNPALYQMAMARFQFEGARDQDTVATQPVSGARAATELMRDGMQAGLFREADPVQTIAAVWGIVHGMVMLEFSAYTALVPMIDPASPRTSSDGLFDAAVRAMLRGLATAEGAAALDAIAD